VRPRRFSAHSSAHILALLGAAAVFVAACEAPVSPAPATASTEDSAYQKWTDPQLDSLADLSLKALRARGYRSTFHPEMNLGKS